MNSFQQNLILGVEPKGQGPRGTRVPQSITPFHQNDLVFDQEYIPEIDEIAGNTSSMLRSAMTLITGRLTVSHSYQRMVAEKVGDFNLNRRLVSISTSDTKIFKEIPNVTVLKGDGQVCDGSFYELNPKHNGNLIASSLAFVDAFRNILDDSLIQWGAITGLKTIDPENTKKAIEIIKYFGSHPNGEIPVNIGEGDAKETNPIYQALRKMRDANFIDFETNPMIKVKRKSNGQIPAMQAKVLNGQKHLAVEFGSRITNYETGVENYIKAGFGDLFDTTVDETYGIKGERMSRISEALSIYKNLSLSPQAK